MISKQKIAKLEEAGYSVSESGMNVLSPNGRVVAGINERGSIFSGSSKVYEILKSKDLPVFSSQRSSQKTSKRPQSRPSTPDLRDDAKAARNAPQEASGTSTSNTGPSRRPRLIRGNPNKDFNQWLEQKEDEGLIEIGREPTKGKRGDRKRRRDELMKAQGLNKGGLVKRRVKNGS